MNYTLTVTTLSRALIYIYIYTYIHIHAYMCIMYTYIYIHTCMYIYIYICIHVTGLQLRLIARRLGRSCKRRAGRALSGMGHVCVYYIYIYISCWCVYTCICIYTYLLLTLFVGLWISFGLRQAVSGEGRISSRLAARENMISNLGPPDSEHVSHTFNRLDYRAVTTLTYYVYAKSSCLMILPHLVNAPLGTSPRKLICCRCIYASSIVFQRWNGTPRYVASSLACYVSAEIRIRNMLQALLFVISALK